MSAASLVSRLRHSDAYGDPVPALEVLPPRAARPQGDSEIIAVFAETEERVDSRLRFGRNSNATLAELRAGLTALGFEVEASKARPDKIRRPVLFGELGSEDLAYEVDAFRAEDGIALEVEAGRGILGNPIYRDLIQTSLLIDARFLVLALLVEYHYKSGGKAIMSPNYAVARSILDGIYASARLTLPLEGILLVGY